MSALSPLLKALAYATLTFAESTPLSTWRSTTWCPSWPRQPNGSHKEPHGHYGKDSKGRSHAGHPQSEIFVLLRNTVGMDDASSHKISAPHARHRRMPLVHSLPTASGEIMPSWAMRGSA